MTTYSHSRLKFFKTCPYGYNRKYNLLDNSGIENWYSEVGQIPHQINEDFYNAGEEVKKLTLPIIRSIMLMKFNKMWRKIQSPPPSKTKKLERYYQITHYFTTFIPNKSVTKVEEHIEWTLPNGSKMQCYIDEQTEDINEGLPTLKGIWDIKPSYKEEYEQQLNTYALAYKAKNGEYPTDLGIREYTTGKTFSQKVDRQRKIDIFATESDIINTISEIESETEWKAKGSYFFCNNLCGFRKDCKFKK